MTRILGMMAAAVLAFSACSSAGTVIDQGEELRLRPLVVRVVERLERYEGPTADAQTWRALFDARMVDGITAQAQGAPVMARHDAAVSADADLREVDRRIALESTKQIRRTLELVASPAAR